jgi:inner membrane protein
MPSPIIHLTAGYVAYRAARGVAGAPARQPVLLLAAMTLSLLPDFDSALGILVGDFGRYHNSQSHSVFVGAAVAGCVGIILMLTGARRPALWFWLTLACYTMHIVLDYFTWGRGVMAWWPLTAERFSSPIRLFYGLHWSHGPRSWRHVMTIVTELPVAFVTILLVRGIDRRRGRVGTRQSFNAR